VEKDKFGRLFDIRASDAATGEVMGEMVALHIRAPKSPFGSDFYMGALKPLDRLVDMRREIGAETMWVLLKLIGSHLDFHNLVQVSPSELAKKLDMHRPNVSRSIKKLVELGVLLEGAKVGMYRSYRLNPHFAWRGNVVEHHATIRSLDKRMKEANIKGVVVPEAD
jgi:DNA-binding transcriptional ArsR family regulator